jgi:hypothetical protein
MSQQRTMARGWTIEGFRSFCAKPDLSLIPRVYEISTNDIVGCWPRPIGRDGPFEFNGLDRLRVLRDGRVCENYIFCNHPFLRRLLSTFEGNSELS